MASTYSLPDHVDDVNVIGDSLEKRDEAAVMECFLTGKPLDPEIARRVHERAQAIRDRVFREHGLVDIAVPAIRELRDE